MTNTEEEPIEGVLIHPDHVMDWLVNYRRSIPMTQTEVAAKMGVHQGRVSEIEHMGPGVRISTLARYAHALGLDITPRVFPREEPEEGPQEP